MAKQQAIAKWAEDHPNETYMFMMKMPGELHAQATKLACLAGVSITTMYTVLFMYGMSHLSQELRDARKAPPVKGPKDFMDKIRASTKEDITPKTTKAHERLLKVPEAHTSNAGMFPRGEQID
jgi:hypothetical protein